MSNDKIACSFLALTIFFGIGSVRAASNVEWSRFRGPNGSGVSSARNLPTEFGPKTNLAWTCKVPAGVSSPILDGGRVFLTGFDGDRRLTLCLDLESGRRLWEQAIESGRAERKTKPNDLASSTPATDGTNVYVLFSGFGLIAYSMTGEERWRKPLGPFNPPHGMASSPILANGNVIVLADQVTDSYIAAFEPTAGKERWRTSRANFVGGYSTPVLVKEDLVVSGPVEMIGYSMATGERRWSVPRMGVMPVGSPVCDKDRIFAYNGAVPPFESLAREFKSDRNGDGKIEPDEFPDPSFKEAVLTIDRNYGNGDGAIDQKEWDGSLRLMNTMNALVAARINGSQATELWRTTKILADAASPLLYQDVLYLVRNGGILSSVDPKTGEVLRQERLPQFEGTIFTSPVAADGKIYIANASGKVAVVAAVPELQTLKINNLSEKCYATPALADGTILIRTEHSLWAFRNL